MHFIRRLSRYSRAAIFILLANFMPLHGTAQGKFVVREGRQLKDSTGQSIRLHGVNLGGWLLWEQWIWGGKFKSQQAISQGLVRLAGTKATGDFSDQIFKRFIGRDDIARVAGHGFNVVRVPFNHCLFDSTALPNQYQGIGWQVLDSVVQWCKQYGVYAILDMHGAPGGQSPYFISDPDKPNLWKKPGAKAQTIALWQAIAQRYKNNTTIAGYDLLNEPIPNGDANLLSLYNQLIKAIRAVDPNHLIILEGSAFASNFKVFTSLPDPNMAFSFHLYTWFGGNPLKKVQKHIDFSKQMMCPCGAANGARIITR